VAKDDGEPLLWVNPRFTFDDMSVCKSSPGVMDLINEMNASDAPVYAHNAYFEQAITNHCPNNRWFQIDISRWRCTAAMSRRAAIPPSLEKAAETLGLLQQKDSKGKALIRKFSIPQKATGEFIHPIYRQDDFIAFCEYCVQDVRVEQGIHKALKHFELTGDTLAAFQADMAINSRGLPVNLPALRHAQSLIEANEARMTEEFRQLTGFNPTQRDVLLKWLKDHGFEGDNLRADTLDEQLESVGTCAANQEVIELRQHQEGGSDDQVRLRRRSRARHVAVLRRWHRTCCGSPHPTAELQTAHHRQHGRLLRRHLLGPKRRAHRAISRSIAGGHRFVHPSLHPRSRGADV